MRLRIIFAALLFAPQQNAALKKIGPWSHTTSDAGRTVRAKAGGATASGLFRPVTMTQPDDKGKKVLKGNKYDVETTVWTKFCDIVRAFDWLFWVLLGILVEKKNDNDILQVIGLVMVCLGAWGAAWDRRRKI